MKSVINFNIDYDIFTKEEICIIIDFFDYLLDYVEKENKGDKLKEKYKLYTKTVNNPGLVKKYNYDFEKQTGIKILDIIGK